MKYWECINVPGMTDAEGVQTSTPSDTGVHVAVIGNIEPSVHEMLMKSNDKPSQPQEGILSEEYVTIVNNAFGIGINAEQTQIEVVPEEIDEEESLEVETVETSQEESAAKYVSSDEVDISNYDIDVGIPDNIIYQPIDRESAKPQNPEESVVPINKDIILSNILEAGCVGSEITADDFKPEYDKTTYDEPPQYSLDEKKLTDVIESLNRYEEKYFKEIPIKHISNRFLRNITKEVYIAHQDAVDKYEDPDLMDPIFLLYPLTTEDPYMAMGKFWNIVTSKISENPEWRDVIAKSIKDYDEYMQMLDEEDDEDDESNE